jgi:anti-sigma factor RsiW
MMCDDARLLLHAYLDDELDAANSAAVAGHMRECPACTARYDAYTTLHKALAQPGLYHQAPDALRQRWTTTKAVPATLSSPRHRRPRAPLSVAAAAGFVAAMLLSGPAWLHLMRSGRVDHELVADVISGHVRSLQGQHLMDVVSTDQHTVKPWFEGRLDFAPRVKDLTDEGFPLIGGRLDAVDGRSVAALVYKRRLHVINLYQWPAETGTPSPQAVMQEHGYTVIRWSDAGMQYVAVSDVSEGDLRQFALAFQNDGGRPGAR